MVIASLALLSMSAFAFSAKQDQISVNSEVKMLLAANVSPKQILADATESGLPYNSLISALLTNDVDPNTFLAAAASGSKVSESQEDRGFSSITDTFRHTAGPSLAGGGARSVSPN